jgi:hypothetical protein
MKPLFSLLIMLAFVNIITAASPIDSLGAVFIPKQSMLENAKKHQALIPAIESTDLANSYYTIDSEEQLNVFGKCTIKVRTELDNGVVIEGTVVIEGIPWYECLGIKIYDVFSSNF